MYDISEKIKESVMETSLIKKTISIVIVFVMLFTMIPATAFAANANEPTMMQFTAASSGDFHRYYNKVYSVTFLDKIDENAMNGALEKWDISANTGSGEVMSWMYRNEEATAAAGADRYDIYIAADGGVWANPKSGFIFYLFTELTEVKGTENFKTDNVTTFVSMFENCYKLRSVSFSECNTENVTSLENMFRNCHVLTELDLSGFDTANVTTMRFMFYLCKKLKNIYVGDGWSTESIENLYDGVFNCCYAIVGGTDDDKTNQEIYESNPNPPISGFYAALEEDGGYLTYKAPEAPAEYTVTYEFIGDVIPSDATVPEAKTYAEGSVAAVEKDPVTAEKYVFSGWTTAEAQVDSDGNFTVNNDVHFVGSWSKLYKVEYKYTEGFEVPDGAPELPEAVYYQAGEDIDRLGVPYVYRHVFIGWTTDDADVTGDMFTMPENDVVFYGYFKIPVESIEIMTEDLTLNEKEEARINVYVKPEDATIKDIVYESDNEDVVKVDNYGNITAVGEGTATITVSSKDDPTKSDIITVTVKVPVKEICVDKTEITLRTDGEDKIDVTVNEDATNKEVTFESSDESVVKVDNNGNIEAIGAGEATITVTSKDDPEKKVTVTVTVKNPVTEITATEDFTLNTGEEKNLEAKVNEDATNKELIYETGNPGIVKVDSDGNVIAVGEGTTVIVITSKDDPTITQAVTVTVVKRYKVTYEIVGEEKPESVTAPEEAFYINGSEVGVEAELYAYGYTFSGWKTDDAIVEDGRFIISDDVHFVGEFTKIKVTEITVDKTEIELEPDGTDKITAVVYPENVLDKGVIFESGDYRVVTVDKDGNVEAVGVGETVITVTSKADPTVKVEIPVKVEKPYTPVNGISINKVKFELTPDSKDKIDVTVRPDDASNKEVSFESSNESVVTVDKDGNIEAVGEGEAIITVTSKDNPNLKIEVSVKVEKPVIPVTNITVDRTEIELEADGKDKITVTVKPDDATDKEVVFESSDEKVVRVDSQGNIEATGEGTATITVKSKANPDLKTTVTVTVKAEKPTEPDVPDEPDIPDEPEYTIVVPGSVTIQNGESGKLDIKISPDDGKIKPTFISSDESIVKVDADGTITGIGIGTATISADFGGGDIRLIPVTVVAAPSIPTPPRKHHVCFGKTDGIGWYEVSVNGGDFFPQGPNSTLEVDEGSILVVRVQDMWIDDEFDFYVNGSKVPLDPANTITVVVDGYMLIGALSMDVPVPDVDESLTFLEKIANFFANIINWFRGLFKR